MARVRASDEVWADFRVAAGGKPINLLLGELVQGEVARWRTRKLNHGQLDDHELVDALGRAHDLHSDLTRIVARLELRVDGQAPAARTLPFDEL